MQKVVVDAVGEQCPIPVVKAARARPRSKRPMGAYG